MNSESGASNQGAKRKADPRPVIWGGCISLAFLIVFFFLQSRTGPLARIPDAFLWFSLVPLVLGLFLGGYVSGVKWGELQFGIPEEFRRELKRVQGESLPVSNPQNEPPLEVRPAISPAQAAASNDLRSKYSHEYENRTNHYMLAHIYRPSKTPGQFDIFIFVARHERGSQGPPKTKFNEIKNAEFYLGPSWRDEVFPVENAGGLIGIRTRAWGTFLACCRLTFNDDHPPVILYRFIDFYMDPTYRKEVFSDSW